jgi:hypothetical protein
MKDNSPYYRTWKKPEKVIMPSEDEASVILPPVNKISNIRIMNKNILEIRSRIVFQFLDNQLQRQMEIFA